jgi:hypothetical protein
MSLSPPSPILRRRPSSSALTTQNLRITTSTMHPRLFSLFNLGSPPSSPISACSDDLVLPLSADAIHFRDISSSSSTTSSTTCTTISTISTSPSRPWWRRTPSVRIYPPRLVFSLTPPQIHAPILFVILLFPLSTALVVASLSTLPTSVSWPRNLADLAQLGRDLHGYSQSGPAPMAHVLAIMAITAIWKHAWSIPGSVVWVSTVPSHISLS